MCSPKRLPPEIFSSSPTALPNSPVSTEKPKRKPSSWYPTSLAGNTSGSTFTLIPILLISEGANSSRYARSFFESILMIEPPSSAFMKHSRPFIGPLKTIFSGLCPQSSASSYSISETTSAMTPWEFIHSTMKGRELVLTEYARALQPHSPARAS